MSDRKKNDHKKEDEEVKYLTLADKQPSIISENISAKSISTRQLSDNLQKTRDGLMYLMKSGGEGNERIRTTKGSDSEADDEDDFQNFGMPIRSKRRGNNGGLDATSSNKMRQIGKNGEMSSKELDNAASNEYGGNDESNMCGHAQRGKSRLNGKGGYDDSDGGKGYNKLFSSQNPKKDGPLYSRIFIDAFIPSLEGNRIFPLCNYRCAEKLERMSEDFYEKQKRKFSKNLLPVTLEDSELGNHDDEDKKIREEVPQQKIRKNSNAYESREMRKVYESQELLELQSVELVQQVELKEEIKPTSSKKQTEQPSTKEKQTEQPSTKEKQTEQPSTKEKQTKQPSTKGNQTKQPSTKGNQLESFPELTPENAVMTENLIQTNCEDLSDKENAQTDSPIELVDDEKVPAVSSTDPEVKQVTSQIESSDQDKETPSTVTDVKVEQDVSPIEVSKPEKVSSELAAEKKVEETLSPLKIEKPSAEEEKLLLKLLGALLANEELIDIFCEKIISKIAARNDFCGSDCKSNCGGCNKPKTGNAH